MNHVLISHTYRKSKFFNFSELKYEPQNITHSRNHTFLHISAMVGLKHSNCKLFESQINIKLQ